MNVHNNQTYYSLTLDPPKTATCACLCQVLGGTSTEQILEGRGSLLVLSRIVRTKDDELKLEEIHTRDVFGIIRGVIAFRIPATFTDQVVVATDSGRTVVLNYDAKKDEWNQIHEQTYGKSGIRRTVPGEYLAAEAKGRCYMLASIEKNKCVYQLQRTSKGGVYMGSVREANSPNVITFALCGLDNGFENPEYAALEVDYGDAVLDSTGDAYRLREKQLNYYQVNLGLNVVVRQWSDTVDYTSNLLYRVPGGEEGPGGVIVCAEDRIYYRHEKQIALSIPIPRRVGPTEDSTRKRIIVAGWMHFSKAKEEFFHLLQTEDGDVFKLMIENAEDATGRVTNKVARLRMKYYDTLPVARSILVLKRGYLYLVAENGNNKVYHINSLADERDDPEPVWTSDKYDTDPEEPLEPIYFYPRELKHTEVMIDIPSLNPLMRATVDNLTGDDSPQIYTICGTGACSTFRTLKHGLPVSEIVSSPLGNQGFNAMWSLKHSTRDEYDMYLILSSKFAEQTIVLQIGDEVEQMSAEANPFLTNRATVAAGLLAEDTLVQVYARGIHSVLASGKVNEWPVPLNRTIVSAAMNERQLVLGLSSTEIMYFVVDADGELNQFEQRHELSGVPTALSIGPIPEGRHGASFVVVACDDCTIRILSLDHKDMLQDVCTMALSSPPTSLEVLEQVDVGSNTLVRYAHAGLTSGLYFRAVIDEQTGDLTEVHPRFLGAKGVKVVPLDIAGQSAVLACTTRAWLGYNNPRSGEFMQTPLDTPQLEAACMFNSEHIQGFCAIQGNNLLIFNIPSIDGRMVQRSMPLQYTPRAMARNPWYPLFYVAQSENGVLDSYDRQRLLAEAQPNGVEKTETGMHSGVLDSNDRQPLLAEAQTNAVDKLDTDMHNGVDNPDTDVNNGVNEIDTDVSNGVNKIDTDVSNGVNKIDADMDNGVNRTDADMDKSDVEQIPKNKPANLDDYVQFGLPKARAHWASCITIIDPIASERLQSIEMPPGEAALSLTCVAFTSRPDELFLAVGTGINMGLTKDSDLETTGRVHIYLLAPEDGKTMTLVHATDFPHPIYALLPFLGRLAVGVGKELFIYDMGMLTMLRKSRGLAVPMFITAIHSQGHRLVVADMMHSVTFVRYKWEFNRLVPFVEDVIKRWTTASTMLDYETVAGGDKFGNIWIVRCPEVASKESDEETAMGHLPTEKSYMGGVPYRLDTLAHFFINDIPTSMQKCSLIAGGQDILLYSTLQGSLRLLIPFQSRDEVYTFTELQKYILAAEKPLSGREHLAYRGYYQPVKSVVDGDLVERFATLTEEQRMRIAREIDKDLGDLETRIRGIRTRAAF